MKNNKENKTWDKKKEMDKIFLKSNIERCRELYDTGILYEFKNSFTQSVFIELLIRLRHIDHVLNIKKDNEKIKNNRDAAAHPYLHREIKDSGIFVDFCRNFNGNWKYENDKIEKQDNDCDVSFQYGSLKISAKEILKLIEEFEIKIKENEK
jgi:hypothetical protein